MKNIIRGCLLALLFIFGCACADGTDIRSGRDLYSLLLRSVEKGDTALTFTCSGEGKAAWSDSDTVMTLLASRGVTGWQGETVTRGDGTMTVRITELRYLAGARILALYRAGRTSELSPGEQETLNAALAVARSASGTDPEKERIIHDALCAGIRYETDGVEGNEDDCATGAMLNGRANCDGYSDAFYLVCSLAGLEVRYIDGEGLTDAPEDQGHMWNLIRLDGSWMMTDVTWDDAGPGDGEDASGNFYLWFNCGADRMQLDHRWNRSCEYWTELAQEDRPELLPGDLRYASVASWEEVESAVGRMALAGMPRIRLKDESNLDLRRSGDRLGVILYRYGVTDYRWHASPDAAEILCLDYQDGFLFCETESQAVSCINLFAGQNVSRISLGFPKALADRLFAEDHRGLNHVFCLSLLDMPVQYSYSGTSGNVTIQSPAWTEDLHFVASLSGMKDVLARVLPGRPEKVQFELTESFDPEPVLSLVHRYGAERFSYSTYAGERFSLVNLTYAPEFALVADPGEIPAYVRSCRERNAPEFSLYLTDADYAALREDYSRVLRDLLEEGGAADYQLYYSDESKSFTVKEVLYR